MLDEEAGVFYAGEKEIALTFYETIILSTLILNKYRVVSFNELAKEVYLEEATPHIMKRLYVNINRIRKKLKGHIRISKKVKVGYYLDMR